MVSPPDEADVFKRNLPGKSVWTMLLCVSEASESLTRTFEMPK